MMFAPDGYVPFSSFLYDASRFGISARYAGLSKDKMEDIHSLFLQGYDDFDWLAVTRYLENDLHIFDPSSGLTLKASSFFLLGTYYTAEINTDEDWPDKGFEIPDELAKKFRFCDPVTMAEYEHFRDAVTARENSDNEAERKNAEDILEKIIYDIADRRGYSEVPLFVIADIGRIDLSLYHFLADNNVSLERAVSSRSATPTEIIAGGLTPFDGWYLCAPISCYGDAWKKHLQKLITQGWLDLTESVVQSRGRPSKKEAVWAAYTKLYPNGHREPGLTWKQVTSEVGSQIGESVSVETLRRAVKNQMS